jgi:hypothetical protein
MRRMKRKKGKRRRREEIRRKRLIGVGKLVGLGKLDWGLLRILEGVRGEYFFFLHFHFDLSISCCGSS